MRMHWATVTSVVVHAGGLIALLLYSFWGIQKLEPRYTPISFTSTQGPPAPAPPPPPPPAGGAPTAKKREKPRTPKEITQPVQVEKRVIEDEPAEEKGEPGGEVGGQAGGEVGGQIGGEIGGILGGVPGGTGNAPVTAPKPEPPRLVAPQMIEGSRIAGNAQIQLPEAVKQIMTAQGIRSTDAQVKLCLSTGGAPTSVDLTNTTGFAEADQKILREVRAWRYRSFMVGGKPVSVCTNVIFRYVLK
jgi:protein TonB